MKRLIRSIVPPVLWGHLRSLRLHHELRSYKVRQVRHTYGAFPLDIELVDGLGEGWYDHDWPELPEFRLLKSYNRLRRGQRIFDLGAHQGVVALILSRYVGAEGAIVALEASKHNADAAVRNVELNDARNCTILHAAVARNSGKLIFSEALNGSVDDGTAVGGQVQVDAFCIDDLADRFGSPDLLFIDVEGYECFALDGARKTLAARPDAFIEVHSGVGLEKYGGSVDKILSFFPPSDYDFHFNEEDGAEFRSMRHRDELPLKRFFLIALARGTNGNGRV